MVNVKSLETQSPIIRNSDWALSMNIASYLNMHGLLSACGYVSNSWPSAGASPK